MFLTDLFNILITSLTCIFIPLNRKNLSENLKLLHKFMFFNSLRIVFVSGRISANKLTKYSNHASALIFSFFFFTDGKEFLKDPSASKMVNTKSPTGNVYINEHEKQQRHMSSGHKLV